MERVHPADGYDVKQQYDKSCSNKVGNASVWLIAHQSNVLQHLVSNIRCSR
jgi:hypothetical protein